MYVLMLIGSLIALAGGMTVAGTLIFGFQPLEGSELYVGGALNKAPLFNFTTPLPYLLFIAPAVLVVFFLILFIIRKSAGRSEAMLKTCGILFSLIAAAAAAFFIYAGIDVINHIGFNGTLPIVIICGLFATAAGFVLDFIGGFAA